MKIAYAVRVAGNVSKIVLTPAGYVRLMRCERVEISTGVGYLHLIGSKHWRLEVSFSAYPNGKVHHNWTFWKSHVYGRTIEETLLNEAGICPQSWTPSDLGELVLTQAPWLVFSDSDHEFNAQVVQGDTETFIRTIGRLTAQSLVVRGAN